MGILLGVCRTRTSSLQGFDRRDVFEDLLCSSDLNSLLNGLTRGAWWARQRPNGFELRDAWHWGTGRRPGAAPSAGKPYLSSKAQSAKRRLPLVALLHEPIQAGFLTSGLGPEVYACGLKLRIRVLRAIWAREQDHNEGGNLFQHGRRGKQRQSRIPLLAGPCCCIPPLLSAASSPAGLAPATFVVFMLA